MKKTVKFFIKEIKTLRKDIKKKSFEIQSLKYHLEDAKEEIELRDKYISDSQAKLKNAEEKEINNLPEEDIF